jgi:hypothetical protein
VFKADFNHRRQSFSLIKNKAVEVAMLMFGVTQGIECISIQPSKGVEHADRTIGGKSKGKGKSRLSRAQKKRAAIIYWRLLIEGNFAGYSISEEVALSVEGKVDDVADAFLQVVAVLSSEV